MAEWVEALWHALFRALYYWLAAVIPAMALAAAVKGAFS